MAMPPNGLIPLLPLGDDPEILNAFRILVGEGEPPPGKDNRSVHEQCHTVLREAMNRVLSSAGYWDASSRPHLKDIATEPR